MLHLAVPFIVCTGIPVDAANVPLDLMEVYHAGDSNGDVTSTVFCINIPFLQVCAELGHHSFFTEH